MCCSPSKAVMKKQEVKMMVNPLFEKRPKNISIGQALQPKRNLTYVLKWPHYNWLQRQRVIPYMWFKISLEINQFTHALNWQIVIKLLMLARKSRPDTMQEKKQGSWSILRRKLLTKVTYQLRDHLSLEQRSIQSLLWWRKRRLRW
ncbi:rCG36064 [Rattus norvegicus]|uniref:60S ribosomal protein L7a n=1 Tax=Rattus norvegicus TaxID=10116 RepID=A6IJJ0_RAT|nr:rCG36064 [Rattus norvegicus]